MTSQKLVPWRRKARSAPEDEEGAEILPVDSAEALERLGPTIEQARENAGKTRAPRTLKAYAKEWAALEKWAAEYGIPTMPLPAPALALYVAHLGTWRRPSGIDVARAAVAWMHRQARQPSPHLDGAVLDQIEALRRTKGTRPVRKLPLTVELLRKAVEAIPESDEEGERDRAILLLCFAGAFRRSELVSLDVEDLTFVEDGVSILLRRSKTDQAGEGMVKAIPFGEHPATCPVKALRAHLKTSSITTGAIFRSLDAARGSRPTERLSGQTVAIIVKTRLEAAGIPASDFSGHSPRAGLVTSAAQAGRDVWEIMATTGQKDADTVAVYVRETQAFKRNAAKGIGL